MTNCLEMLGCKAAPALEPQNVCGAFLLLERRSSTLAISSMTSVAGVWIVATSGLARKAHMLKSVWPRQAVAFHAFKDVNHWYNCWLVSNHHGF